jgi:hypothetical protein
MALLPDDPGYWGPVALRILGRFHQSTDERPLVDPLRQGGRRCLGSPPVEGAASFLPGRDIARVTRRSMSSPWRGGPGRTWP